jgi:hypothetical protein
MTVTISKRLVVNVFGFAYHLALLLAYLSLFWLLFETAYIVFLMETSGWR